MACFRNMTLFSVEGKTAVVTGGSRGIGRMIAGGFVAAGAEVIISARKAAEVEKTAAELGCKAVVADLSTPEGVDALVSAVTGPLHVYPEHAFDKLWNINVKGAFRLVQRLLPRLREAATEDDPARVINVGSVDGIRVPAMETYAYSSTKAAVHMLTRHLARRLAP